MANNEELISKKINRNEIKYQEYIEYGEIVKLLSQKNNFFDSEILEVKKQGENAEIKILNEDEEYWFYFEGVSRFEIDLSIENAYFDELNISKQGEHVMVNFEGADIDITAKVLKIKTIDYKNTKITYASVKYKENQGKTFYYISNIENLKIGDYVWVPVKNEESPGIVENIEIFSYNELPFPIERTKTIIRKSSKQEYENFYSQNDKNDFGIKDYHGFYEFENEETLNERCRKLPFIKTQKTEWRIQNSNEGDTCVLPYPLYRDEIHDWIKAFYSLDLIDKNYIENYENIEDEEIECLSRNEVLTYLTHLIRGERFCEGLIAEVLENGIIERLELRLRALTVEFEEVTDEIISKLKESNIMFFALAESGAMGEPCMIQFVSKVGAEVKFYRTNYADEISIDSLYSVFPTLKTLSCGPFGWVTGVGDDFVYFDMGFGNHLFVNDCVVDLFRMCVNAKSPAELYRDWLGVAWKVLRESF